MKASHITDVLEFGPFFDGSDLFRIRRTPSAETTNPKE